MPRNEDPCPTETQMSEEIAISGWIFESTQTLLSMRVCQLGEFSKVHGTYVHLETPMHFKNKIIYICICVCVFLSVACLRSESLWKMQPSQSLLTTKPPFLSVHQSSPGHQLQKRELTRALRAISPKPLHRTKLSSAQRIYSWRLSPDV